MNNLIIDKLQVVYDNLYVDYETELALAVSPINAARASGKIQALNQLRARLEGVIK